MTKDYEVTICSLPEYDNLVAEIYVGGVFIGLMSQEGGNKNIDIEFPINNDGKLTKINLEIFEKSLSMAKNKIKNLDKAGEKSKKIRSSDEKK